MQRRMRCNPKLCLVFAGSHGKQIIAPPKFSNVDISLVEFLLFLEDIGTLKTAITVQPLAALCLRVGAELVREGGAVTVTQQLPANARGFA